MYMDSEVIRACVEASNLTKNAMIEGNVEGIRRQRKT